MFPILSFLLKVGFSFKDSFGDYIFQSQRNALNIFSLNSTEAMLHFFRAYSLKDTLIGDLWNEFHFFYTRKVYNHHFKFFFCLIQLCLLLFKWRFEMLRNSLFEGLWSLVLNYHEKQTLENILQFWCLKCYSTEGLQFFFHLSICFDISILGFQTF